MIDAIGQAGAARRPTGLAATLTLATLIQVVATASVLGLTALAPDVAADLGIGAHWIGYQISLVYAAGVVSSALAGSFILRQGPERVERLALLLFGFGLPALATAQLPAMLLASVAIGIGYGLNNPAASEMLSRVTPKQQRNIVFSVKQSGVPLGGILAALAFPCLAQGLGWRMALGVSGGVPLLFAIGLTPHCSRPSSARPRAALWRGSLADQRLVFRSARLTALAALGFLYSALQLCVSAFAVVSLVEGGRWSLFGAGAVAATTQFAGAFGRIFWGWVADRIGGFRVLALIGFASGLLCLGLLWLDTMPAPLQALDFVLLGSVSIGWNGVLLAETARHAPPGEVGATTGAVLVYTFIGVVVGPSSFALLYGVLHHYGPVFAIFAVTGFAGGLYSWSRLRPAEGPHPGP